MKTGVIVFPGSNCDHDAWYAFSHTLKQEAKLIWHDSTSVGDVDAIVLPGGFSYGDYLRCGAIAKFSPVMRAVREFARAGGPVLGICNGFQILTECGLLPGALVRNAGLKFVCRTVAVEVTSTQSPFTQQAQLGQILHLPVAHGEGCYVASDETLDRLKYEDRIIFGYLDNPNGSLRNIAGILNESRNVLGMMPHPERAADPVTGGVDGLVIFESLISSFVSRAEGTAAFHQAGEKLANFSGATLDSVPVLRGFPKER
jgi:phosphoribosylformylglycinamidine synthase I